MPAASLSVTSGDKEHRASVSKSAHNNTCTNANSLGRDRARLVIDGRSRARTIRLVRGAIRPRTSTTRELTVCITRRLISAGTERNGRVQEAHERVNRRLGVVQQLRTRGATLEVKLIEQLTGNERKSQSSDVALRQSCIIRLKRMHGHAVDSEAIVQPLRKELEDLRNRNRMRNNPLVVQSMQKSQTNQNHIGGSFGHSAGGCNNLRQLRVQRRWDRDHRTRGTGSSRD